MRGQRVLHAAAVVGHGIEQLVAIADDHLLDAFVGPGALGRISDLDAGLGFHGFPVLAPDLVDSSRPQPKGIGGLSLSH